MSTTPTLSVFISNYNDSATVGRAIEAVMEQSRPPDEFLIYDDGSTDNSRDILQAAQQRYPLLRVQTNPTHFGLSAGLAFAFSSMRGTYCYLGSANDYILPGFFEAALDFAVEFPSAGVIMGEIKVVDGRGQTLDVIRSSRWRSRRFVAPRDFLRDYLQAESVTHSLSGATVWNTAALHGVGDFRFKELDCWCDSFALRAIAMKHGAGYIPRPCSCWTIATDSISQKGNRSIATMTAVIENSAALMRSPEFRDLFPESHIVQWERNFKRFSRISGNWFYVRLRATLTSLLPYRVLAPVALSFLRTYRSFVRVFFRG